MKTNAAILVETGRPLELVELELPTIRSGQVLVEIAYSGACHTQVLEVRGHRGEDKWLPHCLGHEGSGTVLEVGPQVTKVKAGDRVILSWIRGAGLETGGIRYAAAGRTVNSGPVTTFQRHAVVSENRLSLMLGGMNASEAVVLGCALPTGFGAVTNVARLQPGEAIGVFGTGGVGLCAVIGAAAIGGCPIVAIDINPEKLEVALRLGATHAVDARDQDRLHQAIQEAACGPLDVAIEATGVPSVMSQALASVRAQGGRAVVIGNARRDARLELDPAEFNQGKSVLGTWGGNSMPDRDYPRYQRLIASGKLPVASLLQQTYCLEEINTALDDLEAGRVLRPLIDMASP